MPPSPQQVYFTTMKAPKHSLLTIEGLKLAFVEFHREVLNPYPYESAAILLLLAVCLAKYPFYALLRSCFTSAYTPRYRLRLDGRLRCQLQLDSPRPRRGFFSRYGATDQERRDEDNIEAEFRGLLLRVLGLLCIYAALVALLGHGGHGHGRGRGR